MTIEEYQTIIEKTAVYPKSVGIAYCGLGLGGEAGEVSDKIKKLYRDEDLLTTNKVSDVRREELKKEMGDVLWYITALANELGLTLEEVMVANYDKLIARRDTNTLHGSGDDREQIKK